MKIAFKGSNILTIGVRTLTPVETPVPPTVRMWSGSYTDNTWESSLVMSGTDGTVYIDNADQFVNLGNNLHTFITNNSLTKLSVEVRSDLWFNLEQLSQYSTADDVRTFLRTTGTDRCVNQGVGSFIKNTSVEVVINGNFHRLIGLYTYGRRGGGNTGSFIQRTTSTVPFRIQNLVFDRCYFRATASGSDNGCGPFSMMWNNAVMYTENVIFSNTMVEHEGTGSYCASMFGMMNSGTETTYNHINTAFYKCGYLYAKSWSEFACGDGGISNWSSSPIFKSIWNNCTMIENYKAGGAGTISAYYGNRANATLTNATHYGLSSINPQGTELSSAQECITQFNSNTVHGIKIDGTNLIFIET